MISKNFHSHILALVLCLITYLAAAQKVEAEDGSLQGTTIGSSRNGFSGTGYVTGFEQDNDAVTMTLSVTSAGLYDMYVGYAAPYGEKTNDIYVNGAFAGGMVFPNGQSFQEGYFGKVNLLNGENKVRVLKNWGYFELDYIRVEPGKANEIHNYPEHLNNDNASSEAQVIYQFLRDYYGHRIISGQQSYNGTDLELDYIEEHTGKIPAIKGFDLIDYSPSRVERGTTSQQTERSIEWWAKGGVVSMLWHWNAPKGLLDTEDAPWWSGFYTYATTFDLTIAMNDESSEEYELIIRDIDVIAGELKQISNANTPLLWRPLHEAEGGWFWWGAKGPEPCVWLWKLMYDRLTTHHELNNLIWVWTGTNTDDALDWYPGDEYVDIIGADIYLADKNYSASFSMFDDMAGIHEGKKIITLSETGTIPDAQALDDEKARWSWFCTWSGDFVLNGTTNEVSHLNTVYNHEYVITFDELPDFNNYESPDFPDEEVLAVMDQWALKVFPNPTAQSISISGAGDGQATVTVFDLRGKLLFSQSGRLSGLDVDLGHLGSGVYLVKVVKDTGESRSFKVVRR